MVEYNLGTANKDFVYKVTGIAETSPHYGYLEQFLKINVENKLQSFKDIRALMATIPTPKYRLIAGVITNISDTGFEHNSTKQCVQLVQFINLKDSFLKATKDLEKLDCVDRFRDIQSGEPEGVSQSYTYEMVSFPVSYITDIRMVQKLTERLITVERDYLADALINCVNIPRGSNGSFSTTEVEALISSYGLKSSDHLGSLLKEDLADKRKQLEKILKQSCLKRLGSPAAFYAEKADVAKVKSCEDIYAAYMEVGKYEEIKQQQEVRFSGFIASLDR